jgi:hypothetical protein
MNRKLLPYEHELIKALGVTKDEYLQFVAIQQEYADNKAGTSLDIRNIEVGTAALVLTIVGTIFSVGAALLAPKPNIPSVGARNQRRTREQRFAPTFGFNSTQELASYGDPVNLVYTRQNEAASVRVAGSLVWSSVENFGSSQFMRLMLVLGASQIKKIDFERTAFGQTGLGDVGNENAFIFAKNNGVDGPPLFSDLIQSFAGKNYFPDRLKPSDSEPACIVAANGQKKAGFSQAYTPSTATSLGVFDAIPINVEMQSRDSEGKRQKAKNYIKLPSGTLNNSTWRNSNSSNFDVDDKIRVDFEEEGYGGDDKQPKKAGEDMRRQLVETLDFGSTYLLGTTKFKLITLSDNTSINDGRVSATFRCIEKGRVPSTKYDRQTPRIENDALRESLELSQAILADPHKEPGETGVKITKLEANVVYRIESIGNSDFTLIGAQNNKVGEYFTATGPGTGTGKAAFGARTENVEVKSTSAPVVDISFKGNETVYWTQAFTATFDFEDDITSYTYTVGSEDYKFGRNGSIAYTESLKEDLNDDKPKIKTKDIIKKLRKQRKGLRALKEAILECKFDGGDGQIYGSWNSFGSSYNGEDYYGEHPNPSVYGVFCGNVKGSYLQGLSGGYRLIGYDKDFINQSTSVSSNSTHYYTFLYHDSDGVLNLFNFNGMKSSPSSDSDDVRFFPNDDRLTTLLDKVQDTEEKIAKKTADLRDVEKNLTKITGEAKHADQPTGSTGDNRLLNRDSKVETSEDTESLQDHTKRLERRLKRANDRYISNFEKIHKEALKIIDRDIDLTEAIRDALPPEDFIEDEAGIKAVRKAMRGLIKDKESALDSINEILADWDEYATSFDNTFFSKCLVKAEFASYDTLSACNSVKFSLKTRLFRRISGRQKKYGDQKVKEYSSSDNGIKSRMVFFRLLYKEASSNGVFEPFPYVFAIRRGSDADFYTELAFYSGSQKKWQFTFEPVYDLSAEYQHRPFTHYAYIENNEKEKSFTTNTGEKIFWNGRRVSPDSFRGYYPDETERGPIYTNEWDMFSVNSDTQVQFSSDAGPEITITAVSEQQVSSSAKFKYNDMTMMSLAVFSGRGLQDLRSVSALVTEGKLCRQVTNPNATPTRSSSYAPDIFLDTILDKQNGVGKYIQLSNLDTPSLVLAREFCRRNNFPRQDGNLDAFDLYMDGLIADTGSWREFWAEAASFSLLELARKNGKETLVPAVPVTSSGKAAEDDGKPIAFEVSALFTAGNILEGSYKEDFLNYGAATEDLIVSVIYRQHDDNDFFSTKKSVEVRRKGASDDAVRETFDASQFVTQREQAIAFGKLLCNQRAHIRKGIEFKTFPSEALIEPGDFIYVDIGLRHWDKYSSGVVLEGGVLNAPLMDSLSAGTYDFLLYDNGSGAVTSTSASVSVNSEGANVASSLAKFVNRMFVMGQEKPRKQVYRVMEIDIDEEGEVSIRAVEYPCIENISGEEGVLRAKVADFRASKFDVS